uniref:Putative sjoegren syndrome nuclear autoantigen 1 protein n=1 Tax=Xenopsylla cheopis TaxID=163159 RepID=A0A6M2DKY7_XENCH
MAQHGAALQSYNQELVKNLEDLIKKRNDLQCIIEKQEEEKCRVQKEIERLSYKLVQLNESLAQRIAAREDYDRLIAETEAGYVKILESSQVLLSLVKREASCLDQNLSKPSCGGATPCPPPSCPPPPPCPAKAACSSHNYKYAC